MHDNPLLGEPRAFDRARAAERLSRLSLKPRRLSLQLFGRHVLLLPRTQPIPHCAMCSVAAHGLRGKSADRTTALHQSFPTLANPCLRNESSRHVYSSQSRARGPSWTSAPCTAQGSQLHVRRPLHEKRVTSPRLALCRAEDRLEICSLSLRLFYFILLAVHPFANTTAPNL